MLIRQPDFFCTQFVPSIVMFFRKFIECCAGSLTIKLSMKNDVGLSFNGNCNSKIGRQRRSLSQKTFRMLKCKRTGTLKPLIKNFKCADIICDFCGYLAQVKTNRVNDISASPKSILAATWLPQKERMDAGIFFVIFLF